MSAVTPSIQLDLSRFTAAMTSLRDALLGAGQDSLASDIVESEARRLVKQVVKLTPPKSQVQGQRTIEKELGSFIAEVNDGFLSEIGSRYGTTNIDVQLSHPTRGGVERLVWGRIDPTGEQLPRLHRAARNKRGKVPRVGGYVKGVWRARVVVPYGIKKPYIEKVKARVGRFKASWGASAVVLGLTVSPWIRRHIAGNPKAVIADKGTLRGDFPFVKFGSRAPGVDRQTELVRSAIRTRTKTMRRRIVLILSNYSKSVKAGMLRINAMQAARAQNKQHGESNLTD